MRQKEAILLESVELVQVEKPLGYQTRFSAIGRDGNSIASALPQASNCQVDLTLAGRRGSGAYSRRPLGRKRTRTQQRQGA